MSYSFTVDVYNAPVALFFDRQALHDNIHQVLNIDKDRIDHDAVFDGLDGTDGFALALTPPSGQQHYVLYLKDPDALLIAHECCHLADMILHHRNISLDFENTEVRAYLTGHLVDRVTDYWEAHNGNE